MPRPLPLSPNIELAVRFEATVGPDPDSYLLADPLKDERVAELAYEILEPDGAIALIGHARSVRSSIAAWGRAGAPLPGWQSHLT